MFSLDDSMRYWLFTEPTVTGINKYSEIGNVSAVKMESVIQ